MVYMSDEEIKHNEFIVLRNNICKSMKDINKVIEEEFNNKNILINNKKWEDNGYKKKNIINKKDDKKIDNKKKPDDKYNYNLSSRKIKNIFKKKIIRLLNIIKINNIKYMLKI